MAVDRLIRGGEKEDIREQSSVSKLIKDGSVAGTEVDTVQQVAESRMLSIENSSAQPL